MKVAILSIVGAATATYAPVYNTYGNDGYVKPVYPVYPQQPIQPVYPVQPIAPVVPVQPIAPTTTTVVVEAAPTVTATVKIPRTMSCKRWNKLVNEEACEVVNKVKCTTKWTKKSKFDECSEETCCAEEEEVEEVVEVAKATATVIPCAQYAGENKLQCQVVVEGACAVEGPFGEYNQCSKDLCCREAAPVLPQPQIVSCKAVVAGNGWNCGYVPNYGCSLTGPSGNYPACTYDACCTFPGPVDPVDPCDYCDLPYAYCPSYCNAANKGYY
jgi:hypothetical protein